MVADNATIQTLRLESLTTKMSHLTKDIFQLDADRYTLYDKLGKAFFVNTDKQTCSCGKFTCLHLVRVNQVVYPKGKRRGL